MIGKIFNGTVLTLGVCCFIVAFVIELFNFNMQSCWLFAGVILSVIILFYPRLLKHMKRKYSFWFNAYIFFNAFLFLALCLFLMANLIYFAVKGVKIMEGYQLIIYPLILVFCLGETYIDFIRKEKFKRNPDDDFE